MILDDIVAYKKELLKKAKEKKPLDLVKNEVESVRRPLDFFEALMRDEEIINVIAEVKKASPSKGVIREDFDPPAIAGRYEECGASAISVLTDEKFFQGSLEYLKQVKNAVSIPVLRKEFIIDEYQVYEARAAGADAVLLIVAILEKEVLQQLYDLTRNLGMSALVEVHSMEEAKTAMEISPRIIGINNRNLKNFTVDLATTPRISEMLPDNICIVGESGIRTRDDIQFLAEKGINAVLIGETFMRAPDPGTALNDLIS